MFIIVKFERINIFLAGKLASLVRVDNLRLPILFNRCFDCAKIRLNTWF